MYEMNNVQIMGNLVSDPMCKTKLKGDREYTIANFTVAVNRPGKKKGVDGEEKSVADYIDCVAFGSSADFVKKYLGKGSPVKVGGVFQNYDYVDDSGKKVQGNNVLAEDVSSDKELMFDFNQISTTGRFTKDPELKESENGKKFVRFALAVNRPYYARKNKDGEKEETDFFNYVAFGKNAEYICKYMKKGSTIAIMGEIGSSTYEKDGEKKYSTEIRVVRASFSKKRKEKEKEQKDDQPQSAPKQGYDQPDGYHPNSGQGQYNQPQNNPQQGGYPQNNGQGQYNQPQSALSQGYNQNQQGGYSPNGGQGQYNQPQGALSQGYNQNQQGGYFPNGGQGQYNQPQSDQYGWYGQAPAQAQYGQSQQAEPVEEFNPYDPENIFGLLDGVDGVEFD